MNQDNPFGVRTEPLSDKEIRNAVLEQVLSGDADHEIMQSMLVSAEYVRRVRRKVESDEDLRDEMRRNLEQRG